MAWANVSPGMSAAMNRVRAEREAMNSPDPVIRYNAKQRATNRAFLDIGLAMVRQAKLNAKGTEQQELEAQRFEREYYKNK